MLSAVDRSPARRVKHTHTHRERERERERERKRERDRERERESICLVYVRSICFKSIDYLNNLSDDKNPTHLKACTVNLNVSTFTVIAKNKVYQIIRLFSLFWG